MTTNKNTLKYQTLDDIELEEVPNAEADKMTYVVNASNGMPPEDVRGKVMTGLVGENWWLNDYWQEKELPREQITITAGDHALEVYNFSEKLTPEQIGELNDVVRVFSHIKNGEVLSQLSYILIDDEQHVNTISGKALNGKAPESGDRAIKIYPNALKSVSHRVNSVSNFKGTLIHEFSHLLKNVIGGRDFVDGWIDRFGWINLEGGKGVKLAGGETVPWRCDLPNRCITDYAQSNPEDDVCDSMVGVISNSESLDSEKREALKGEFPEEADEKSEVFAEKKESEAIQLPHMENLIRFTRKSLIRSSKSI